MDPVTTTYLYLLLAIAGASLLFWAGYLQYRGKQEMIPYLIGTIAIGVAFINLSAVQAAHVNPFVIFIWFAVHLFICWLIVEGSTRFFMRLEEKRTKRDDEIIKKDEDKWYDDFGEYHI